MNNNKPYILVTGAKGFIASQLISVLKKNGAYIRGIDICESPYDNCDESIQCDLSRPLEQNQLLRDACNGIDIVYHLAAKVHSLAEVKADKDEYWHINVDASNNLLSAAKEKNVKKFIFFSSVKVFGERQMTGGEVPLSEKDEPFPDTPYGETKLAFEQILLNETSGIDVVILRLAMVYGPHTKGNLAKMIKIVQSGIPLLLPDFKNKRSMVDVRDVINVALLACQRDKMHGLYQITDGNVYSTKQITDTIYDALGKKRLFFSLPKSLFSLMASLGDLIGKIRKRRFIFDSDTLNKLSGNAFFSSNRLKDELNFSPEWTLQKSLFVEYKGNKEN